MMTDVASRNFCYTIFDSEESGPGYIYISLKQYLGFRYVEFF
jgi:hypothetical protein